MITHDPLHRSGRAELPHPAPTLGTDAETLEGIRMADASGRKPPGEVPCHPLPGQMISLATATQHAPPDAADCQPVSADGSTVQGHAVVAHMPENDRAHIGALLPDGPVHASPEFGIDLSQLRLPPLSHRQSQHREPTLARLPATMRETEEVEGLRFACAIPARSTCSPGMKRVSPGSSTCTSSMT